MVNQALVATLNSVLGQGKKTSKGNYAYHCPFCNHHKPKLEVNYLRMIKVNTHGIVGFVINEAKV